MLALCKSSALVRVATLLCRHYGQQLYAFDFRTKHLHMGVQIPLGVVILAFTEQNTKRERLHAEVAKSEMLRARVCSHDGLGRAAHKRWPQGNWAAGRKQQKREGMFVGLLS